MSKPNYHTTKYFSEDLLAIEMNKIKVKVNKPDLFTFRLANIRKISRIISRLVDIRTLMYEFWYDYIKQKYQQNTKQCYIDSDSFIIHVKTENIYEDIADDVKKRIDTSNYKVDRPLPTGKNKKVIGLMKDELGETIMTEFVALRPKTYS